MTASGRKRTVNSLEYWLYKRPLSGKADIKPETPKIELETSALPSEADIQLNLLKRAANDPKRTSQEAAPGVTNPLHPPVFYHSVAGSGVLSLPEKDGFR